MKLDRIHRLLKLVPRRSRYISIVSGGDPRFDGNPDVDLWATVKNDPSFCYSFVGSFCESRKFMPDEVFEGHLWRLYAFRRYRNWDDRVALETCALTHPKMKIWRTIIECFLMHPGVKFEWISSSVGFPIEIIKLYHEWFFNVRDRMASQDSAFILSLVYPESRQVEFSYNYHLSEDWSQIARRIAYNKGLLSMLRWLGGRPSESELAGSESMRALESGIASGGRFAIDCGFLNQPNVISISSGRQLIQSSKIGGQDQQDDDARIGFQRISADQSCQLVIKQMTQTAALQKLHAAQLYDRAIADQQKIEADKRERELAASV